MMLPDRRGLTLQPLVTNGVFEAGPKKLSCTVGGVEYYAGAHPYHSNPEKQWHRVRCLACSGTRGMVLPALVGATLAFACCSVASTLLHGALTDRCR
jgi:hypothetical protein